MAEERINPFFHENRYSLDHLTRYAFARPLVRDKRVLDIACGTGFGSALLAQSGVRAIHGVDVSAEAIAECRRDWPLHGLTFYEASIEAFCTTTKDRYDVIVCFETLEHLADPWTAVESLRSLLAPGGLLIGSVPGETERADDNPFHLHRFTVEELKAGLSERFFTLRLLRQRFFVESTIEDADEEPPTLLQERHPADELEMDFARASGEADTYLFIATPETTDLPEIPSLRLASRQVWLATQQETTLACEATKRFSSENDRLRALLKKIYAEHGELAIKFTNTLGWGTYHFEQIHGRPPERSYMEEIASAQSAREKDLEKRLHELSHRIGELESANGSLRQRLAACGEVQKAAEAAKRARFIDALQPRSPEPP